MTGFLSPRGRARGRPVGVAVDGRGGLLIADDVGGAVWRVSAAGGRRRLVIGRGQDDLLRAMTEAFAQGH